MIKSLNGKIIPLTDEEIAQVELKNKTWNDQAYERNIANLRLKRNQLLQETDWRMVPDYPGTNQADWQAYRQALRDLPETQTPALDENGNLINVNWPTPPTE